MCACALRKTKGFSVGPGSGTLHHAVSGVPLISPTEGFFVSPKSLTVRVPLLRLFPTRQLYEFESALTKVAPPRFLLACSLGSGLKLLIHSACTVATVLPQSTYQNESPSAP